MNVYVISIGSNVADAADRVERAIAFLATCLHDMSSSTVYSTPSVSGDGTVYCNAVVRGAGDMSPEEMEVCCKNYELSCGRVRGEGCEVVMDMDVVMCDDTVLRPKDFGRNYFTIGFEELP